MGFMSCGHQSYNGNLSIFMHIRYIDLYCWIDGHPTIWENSPCSYCGKWGWLSSHHHEWGSLCLRDVAPHECKRTSPQELVKLPQLRINGRLWFFRLGGSLTRFKLSRGNKSRNKSLGVLRTLFAGGLGSKAKIGEWMMSNISTIWRPTRKVSWFNLPTFYFWF